MRFFEFISKLSSLVVKQSKEMCSLYGDYPFELAILFITCLFLYILINHTWKK